MRERQDRTDTFGLVAGKIPTLFRLEAEAVVEGGGERRVVVLAGRNGADAEAGVAERADDGRELHDLGACPERHEHVHTYTSVRCRVIVVPARYRSRSGSTCSPRIPRTYSPTRSAPASSERGSPPEKRGFTSTNENVPSSSRRKPWTLAGPSRPTADSSASTPSS